VAKYPHVMLTTAKLPTQWLKSGRVWLDMTPGAEVELPGIGFRCRMHRRDDRFELELEYAVSGESHTHIAEMGAMLDVSRITGYPCVVIPRAIRPCNAEKPAAVMLEIATGRRKAA